MTQVTSTIRQPFGAVPAVLRHPAVKYLLVGGGTFAADLLLLILFHGALHLPLSIATGIAYAFATAGNFLLNRSITFSQEAFAGPATRYLILVAANLLLSVLLIPAATFGLGVDYRLAKVAVSVSAVVWNYVAYRMWVFT
jgi:putative flippase GtrA